MLDFDPLRNQRILQFLKLLDSQGAFSEGRIQPADLCFQGIERRFQAADLVLGFGERVFRPALDAGQKFFLPLGRKRYEFDVSSNLAFESVLPRVAAVVATHFSILVRAAVIKEFQAAFLDLSLAGDAVAARAASRESEEQKSFLRSEAVSGLSVGNQGALNIVEGLFGNHRQVRAGIEFAFVIKDAVIKRLSKNVVN